MAEWTTPPSPTPFDPLEERVLPVRVCASLGPFEISVASPQGELLTTMPGAGVGPKIRVPSTVAADDLVVGLPRIMTATVVNDGAQSLFFERVSIIEATGVMARLVDAPRAIVPKGRAEIQIEVRPTQRGNAVLRVDTNDPARPSVDIDFEVTAERRSCDFALLTPTLDFGLVPVRPSLAPDARMALIMENRGSTECIVLIPRTPPAGLFWRGPIPGRSWDDQRRSVRIPAGRRVALPIGLVATTDRSARETMTLEIAVADSAVRRDVQVAYSVQQSGLTVVAARTPACVDGLDRAAFQVELTWAGMPVERATRVVGLDVVPFGAPVQVSGPRAPFTISAGATEVVELALEGASLEAHAAHVEVRFIDGAGEERVARRTVVADFVPRPNTVDVFVQRGIARWDSLYVIDGSRSMDDIEQVDANVRAWASVIAAQAFDDRIAFASVDPWAPLAAPPGEGPTFDVVGLSPDEVADAMQRRLDIARRASIASLEQPLDATRRAVDELRRQGLLRDDARLSVTVITDEDDRSPGPTEAAIEALLRVRGFRNTSLFGMGAVAAGGLDGCRPPRSATDAPRIIDVVERTGGVLASACATDWSAIVESLSTRAFGWQSRFLLTQLADEGSIRVSVNGVEVPSARPDGTMVWTYNYPTNEISFSPSGQPPPSARIDVRYRVVCF